MSVEELRSGYVKRAREALEGWLLHGKSWDVPYCPGGVDLTALANGVLGIRSEGIKTDGPVPEIAKRHGREIAYESTYANLIDIVATLDANEVKVLSAYYATNDRRPRGDVSAAKILGVNRHDAKTLRESAEMLVGVRLQYGA